jgi:DNA mismatch repair protein MutS
MTVSTATPMIQQYLSIKSGYPDVLLFYRMGDFYEMFFEDAEVASRALEITLTSRNKNAEVPIPMCGVPVRAVQGYIARLIEQGYKVAICEQTQDPATAKGLVARDVVRVITPGMIIEEAFLDEKAHNYILAVHRSAAGFGIASLDISTASFRVAESSDPETVVDEIRRIDPREILMPDGLREDRFILGVQTAFGQRSISWVKDEAFSFARGRQRLIEQLGTLTLEGFGCESLEVGVGAAGALLYYVQETQKQKIAHLTRIETYSLSGYLQVDERSCQNLELIKNLHSGTRRGTLVGVLDKTATPMGARLIKQWIRYPLMEPDRIAARLDAVEEAKAQHRCRQDARQRLGSVADLERLCSKVAMGHANARDLIAIKTSLNALPHLFSALSPMKASLFSWHGDLEPLVSLADLIERAIREDAPLTIQEGRMIRTGFDAQLDELIQISREGKGWLARLEVKEKQATGLGSLKVRYNKVFGYYIEVPKTHSQSVPAHYVRKQTLVNAERYITEELKDFEQKVLHAEERRASLEYRIFNDIRQHVMDKQREIADLAAFVAALDVLVAFAEVADTSDYTRPEINTENRICLQDGRHPVVEKLISGERFVPNTVCLDDETNQVLIITGPNMAGKSTILRQVALTVIMAQMGCFVPASGASIAITDRIFTRVGALDNLSGGQSTFMVEMEETANILNHATEHSLVILDEIGRGTSTFDGLSIAWAVAEYLHDLNGKGVRTLFATHYHELTELARTHQRVKNFNIAVKEYNDQIIFLRRLVQGATNRSYGIQVARLAGIPASVIDRSKKVLERIETGDHTLKGLSPASAAGGNGSRRPRQLKLFNGPETLILEALKQLDIARLTPLEALNCLDELKRKADLVA